jgi:dTDP-4-dehydrorhamnose reductase
MSALRVLVTGATGMLGCALAPYLQSCGHKVIRHGFSGLADVTTDLRERAPTAAMLDQCQPDAIIHLAALTNVDLCQTDPHQAYLLNVRTVENLCHWIKRQAAPCRLIHISTDQVYDGGAPSTESQVAIKNVYAFSKIASEIAAAAVPSCILRTNFFGRSQCLGRASFSDWLYRSLTDIIPIKVFDDVLFSALSINTLVGLIEKTLHQRMRGVYNLGAHGGMSKADFAFAFAAALGLPDGHMQRTELGDMPSLSAYRPKDMRMDSTAFEERMTMRLPQLIDEIHLIRSDYLEHL